MLEFVLFSYYWQFTAGTFVRIIFAGGGNMVGKCTFAPDINKCQYFIPDKEGCSNDVRGCSFFMEIGQEKEIEIAREPKWFEKYYKK